eukprot:m.11761 g.11761  ORF g.11761 m.11761 type:complete len:418 (+) comp4515_c0_seq1:133-1386(+)
MAIQKGVLMSIVILLLFAVKLCQCERHFVQIPDPCKPTKNLKDIGLGLGAVATLTTDKLLVTFRSNTSGCIFVMDRYNYTAITKGVVYNFGDGAGDPTVRVLSRNVFIVCSSDIKENFGSYNVYCGVGKVEGSSIQISNFTQINPPIPRNHALGDIRVIGENRILLVYGAFVGGNAIWNVEGVYLTVNNATLQFQIGPIVTLNKNTYLRHNTPYLLNLRGSIPSSLLCFIGQYAEPPKSSGTQCNIVFHTGSSPFVAGNEIDVMKNDTQSYYGNPTMSYCSTNRDLVLVATPIRDLGFGLRVVNISDNVPVALGEVVNRYEGGGGVIQDMQLFHVVENVCLLSYTRARDSVVGGREIHVDRDGRITYVGEFFQYHNDTNDQESPLVHTGGKGLFAMFKDDEELSVAEVDINNMNSFQ